MARISSQTLKTFVAIAVMALIMTWHYAIAPEITAVLIKDFAPRKHSKDFRTSFIEDIANLTAQQQMPIVADNANVTAQYQVPDLSYKSFVDVITIIDNAVAIFQFEILQMDVFDNMCENVQTLCSEHMAKHPSMKDWCAHIRAVDARFNLVETCHYTLHENLDHRTRIKSLLHEALTFLTALNRMNPEMADRVEHTRHHIDMVFAVLDKEDEDIFLKYLFH